ncbi:adenosine deaminase isoform X2 [Anabrus simplex]|uniref:adenosine deaminase isoform X2 n=1 Tax=Anabrus simplex TaxID=316456 RepID=UPI0034DD3126
MFPSHKTIKNVPLTRVELHVHLDGCVRPETLWDLANEKHFKLPGNGTLGDLKKALVIRDPIDLRHFLQPFQIITPCVVSDLKAMERIATEFCEDKARNGVLYAEARFSPHLWLSAGDCRGDLAGLGEVIQAVTRGFHKGEELFGIKVRTILCSINGMGTANDVLQLCQKFRGEGVVGMDLAGNCMSDLKPYVEVPLNPEELHAFEEARKSGIHRTLHAGESGGPEMVHRAVENYHAERIGHGYHVLESREIYSSILEKQIHLETCPYSSLLTGAVPLSTVKHPIVHTTI